MIAISRRFLCVVLIIIGLLGSVRFSFAKTNDPLLDNEGDMDLSGHIKPGVAAQLKRSTAAYRAMKSYYHRAMRIIQSPSPEGSMMRQKYYFTLALARPNRFVFKSSNIDLHAAACDGNTFVNYRSDLGEYMQIPAPATYKEINIVDDVMFLPIGTYVVALMLQGNVLADTTIREVFEEATIQENVLSEGKRWQVVSAPFRNTKLKIYFDSKTQRLARLVMLEPGAKATVDERLEEVKVNLPVAASVFSLTLPDSARRVHQFSDRPQQSEDEQIMKEMAQKFEGKMAPDFTLRDQEGKEVTLSSLRGKIIVLDFWASWCVPCKKVMPILQEIHEKGSARGVVVLGINSWDEAADATEYLHSNTQYSFPILSDPSGKDVEASLAKRLYEVPGIPTTIVIDRAGVIKKYILGAHDRNVYVDALKKLGVSLTSQ
jgi:peroxiredoxin/outer membrane lipoprotein-sorting protein